MVIHTQEFDEFFAELNEWEKVKFIDCLDILGTVSVLSVKFVKRLIGTDFYEMRVSVGINEYRSVIFPIDHENIMQAKKIILLNGFLKKSTKDYDKHIKKLTKILNNLEL